MAAINTEPPVSLEQVMQADRFGLSREWQRLGNQSSPPKERIAKWRARAEESAKLLQERAATIPNLDFDPELPISAHREELVDLIRTRQTIVVCGETGSGKSTQLPKICLEAGLGVRGMIGHTQPRRLAARAVSNRLAEELGTRVGEKVGFKIRFTDKTNRGTLVKLMTDGILLAETQSDRFLDNYDALIIDEAHERSLNIDFLLGYLRKISARRPDLKLIITSATIDPQKFADHFADEAGPAPIVEVSGRTYPVEVRYRPPPFQDSLPSDDTLLKSIADAVDELFADEPGDVLTFLPTERDIRLTAKHLRGHFSRLGQEKSVEILPLYARLSHAEQNKIFASHARRRIVLATNVAESSLTVPGIRTVIDTGLVRISRYAPRSGVQRLPIEDISQASANQRSGRCGRVGPGICIRLYSQEDFEKRPQFTTPEIKRSDLASVILQSHVLKLGALEEFPLLDAPSAESMRDGRRTLQELGAIDDKNRLTKIGQQLGALPSDPRVGRMLIEANERNCLAEVTIIAAALECQDVRQRPAGQRPQADEAQLMFQDPHSDFLSYIRLWDFYEKLRSDLGRSRLQRALQQRFLSFQGFREWSDTVRQLRELLSSAKLTTGKRRVRLPEIDPDVLAKPTPSRRGAKQTESESQPKVKLKRPEGYAAIHQSLLAGILSGIAQKGDRHEYKAARGLTVSLWPGSGLFQRQPRWVMVAEIVETNRRYGRTVAEVDVEWIEKAGETLLKHTYSDPHWSSKTGAAMVYLRSSLFGLPVVAGRRVPLTPIDPGTARSLMIEHGLAGGEWNCREKFYLHNQEMIADMDELAKRTRSSEFIVDRFHLMSFYGERIPETVTDLQTLRSWLKKCQGSPEEKALWMQPEDLLEPEKVVEDVECQFPNEMQVGPTALPLSYHFEPGTDDDGVTITVPQVALQQISDESLGWLVPGLLTEKIQCLIKALPKSLRTNFVPAPDVAKKLTKQLESASRDLPFSSQLCEAMKQYSGERIRPSDFRLDQLPEHLKFLVRVIDDEGKTLAEGRDVETLQAKYALGEAANLGDSSDSQAAVQGTPESTWTDRVIRPDTFETIPESISIRRGGVLVASFPALYDCGESVELRLADTKFRAEEITTRGLVRLYALKHNRTLKSQVSHLPGFEQHAMRLAHLVKKQDLKKCLQDLIIRLALVEDQPPVRDRESFEARNARAQVQITIATQEVSTWLPKFAEAVHAVRLKLERSPATWGQIESEVREQLDDLLPADFLATIPWNGLSEYPRYLNAICMRFEKLTSGGIPKDRRLAEPLQRVWNDYCELKTKLKESPSFVARLDQLRWMIEEFRVSIYAQTLGTKQSVSEKRIREFIDKIEL